jgi:hypothetical protein
LTTEERNIREALEKTGFPLELEIGSIVEGELTRDESWGIYYNNYYLDEEQSKDREIDIAATKYSRRQKDENIRFRVLPTIFFECKKCANAAWVFFVKKVPLPLNTRGEYFDTFELIATPTSELRFAYADLTQNSEYRRLSNAATSYCQVRIDKPQIVENSELFEATRQLVKAIRWEYVRRLSKLDHLVGDDIIFLYFPTIVFDGKMYEAHLSNGALNLTRTNHVIVKTDYKSPSADKPQDFYIDVVSKEEFGKWLQTWKRDVLSICDIVKDPKLAAKRLQLRKKFMSE